MNDRFYLLYSSSLGTDVYLRTAVENEFLGELISEEPYYSNYNFLKRTLLLIVILLFGGLLAIIGIRQFKKRDKIVLLDNGLRYKNKFTEFDQKAMGILKLLVLGVEVSSNKILSIVEEAQYSAAHNERLKVQKLAEINLKIKTLLRITDDIILSKKSDSDKRIRVYFVNKNLFYRKKNS